MLEVGTDRSSARAREDYVKAIYQLGEMQAVKAADVARYLGVSPVAVSKAKRLLEREGLLEPVDHRTNLLALTLRGRELALAMVRRHRLLETFLHGSLGVPLDRIHAEAERIEHVISDDIAQRLATMLGCPPSDPHGHPIPYGDMTALPALPALTMVPPGSNVRVVSLDDRDSVALKTLVSAGILPGVEATVVAVGAEHIRLRWNAREADISVRDAGMVHVALIGERHDL